MSDLTLNEYRCFSEEEIKKVLLEEEKKINGSGIPGRKNPAAGTGMFRNALLKTGIVRFIHAS